MADPRSPLTAVLGPTNTGKTHLAIERMCAHSSGIMGFPLRLLAREVYDRVVAIKGANQVALVTGEEKIVPPHARWFLCTAESMPTDRDAAFLALDEAQLGSDPERGHVFTDRLLRARGREETMLLGSETLRPVLRALLPDAQVINRPRFSTLAYAGSCKLSRLPPRSVVVAFSAEEVYAVAEMLRRFRGGAAVVMGALSPRTRNAQVAMYQAGEVDYLVATDAIGMGLNMDVAHVAFAGLHKFDGRRRRRLTVAEMAQIAGRAGRHQRDGSFGSLAGEGAADAFTPEEVAAIEEHRFQPLDHLYWREGSPDFVSLDKLISSLERRPNHSVIRAAPEAIDLAVLKRLGEDDEVRRLAAPGERALRRLWAACGLPDFRKTGPEHHSRLVSRIFGHLSTGDGRVPQHWFAEQVARLDNAGGDIEQIADRLAGVRTWAYIAQRPDWLLDPAGMAERTREVEARLSDALHQRLTQRFVDRRTSVLLRDLGRRGASELPVTVGEQGEVMVGDAAIGTLEGFAFTVDPTTRHADRKLFLAAAERRLSGELARRAGALAGDVDDAFELHAHPGHPAFLRWRGHPVARLEGGRALVRPRLVLAPPVAALDAGARDRVRERLERWLHAQLSRRLAPLQALDALIADGAASPNIRALAAQLADAGGFLDRETVAKLLPAVDRAERRRFTQAGFRFGALDLFAPALLKPEATRWRAVLQAVRAGEPSPELPPAGAAVLPADDAAPPPGFRRLGPQAVRLDVVDRLATHAHEARAGKRADVLDAVRATSLGLRPETVAALMRALGFRAADTPAGWLWIGRRPPRAAAGGAEHRPARPGPGNAFAELGALMGSHG